MKDEYDFSNAVRGKFFRPGAALLPPVHLEPDISDALLKEAKTRGKSLNSLVNELLRHDMKKLLERSSAG